MASRKQAANLNLGLPLALPGIKVTTNPIDFAPIQAEQLVKFDGRQWVRFGDVMTSS